MIFEEYIFLFVLAGIWVAFASFVDLKIREVPNWLNFSLVAFALAYRAFYSAESGQWSFLMFGIFGFIIFFGLGNLFYYTKVFAGGDAKLLMGIGTILPFESFSGMFFVAFSFILFLFIIGSIYGLIYSVGIVIIRWNLFRKEFYKNAKKYFLMLLILSGAFALFYYFMFFSYFSLLIFPIALSLSLLYLYAISLDVCMIKLSKPNELREGDWLTDDVRVGQRVIKKSVHGLSMRDIIILRKANKKIYIKEGIPFVPAFLLALIFTVFFLVNGLYLNWTEFLVSLLF